MSLARSLVAGVVAVVLLVVLLCGPGVAYAKYAKSVCSCDCDEDSYLTYSPIVGTVITEFNSRLEDILPPGVTVEEALRNAIDLSREIYARVNVIRIRGVIPPYWFVVYYLGYLPRETGVGLALWWSPRCAPLSISLCDLVTRRCQTVIARDGFTWVLFLTPRSSYYALFIRNLSSCPVVYYGYLIIILPESVRVPAIVHGVNCTVVYKELEPVAMGPIGQESLVMETILETIH